VNTVVSNANALEPAALKLAGEIFESPDSGRRRIKGLLRGGLGRSWGDRSALEREAHQSWGFLTKTETVKALEAAMLRLSKRKNKSKVRSNRISTLELNCLCEKCGLNVINEVPSFKI
jgi:enoyl-CoA hydratase/carnithine racemase